MPCQSCTLTNQQEIEKWTEGNSHFSEMEFLEFLGVAESHEKMPGNDNIRDYSCSGHHCKG